jgi:hypothetical protein
MKGLPAAGNRERREAEVSTTKSEYLRAAIDGNPLIIYYRLYT